MKAEYLFKEYSEGRRDFRGVRIRGQDMFAAALRDRNPALFSQDVATLILMNDPVIKIPIDGAILVDSLFENASLIDTDLTKAIMCRASLKSVDARFLTLSGADLTEADLQSADLRGADLSGANLEAANLADAKLDHCIARNANLNNAILSYVTAIGADFSKSSMLSATVLDAQFSRARLYRTNLSDSVLDRSNFQGAHFDRAIANGVSAIQTDFKYANATHLNAEKSDFSRARFNLANLSHANLTGSTLTNADLSEANLSFSVLDRATLDRVSLTGAMIHRVSLQSTSFSWANIGGSSFSAVDLTPLIDSNISHFRPSAIDHLSVAITLSKNPSFPFEINPAPGLKRFLEASGMPNLVALYLIDSIRTLQPDQLISLMRSTFISFGQPDEAFARRLNDDLTKHGVVTFFFPSHAQFGEKLHSTMRRVDDYERIILICSKESLNRAGLQYELEKTLEREARDGGISYLIPITLDRYLFDGWKPMRPELRQEVLNRVVADFSNLDDYDNQFARLLHVLRKELSSPTDIV